MAEHLSNHKRRIRLLYSLKDIGLAIGAADFLAEIDPVERISRGEMCRYKCFETTAIMAYSRPFSDSRGDMPKLSFKMIDVRLSNDLSKLHEKIISLRNRVIAHSDAEMMRMVVKAKNLNANNADPMQIVQAAFDEGLELLDLDLWKVSELFNIVHFGLYRTIWNDAQVNPELYDFRLDYLNRDAD